MEELRKIKDEIAKIKRAHLEVGIVIGKVGPPFTEDILDERMPSKF